MKSDSINEEKGKADDTLNFSKPAKIGINICLIIILFFGMCNLIPSKKSSYNDVVKNYYSAYQNRDKEELISFFIEKTDNDLNERIQKNIDNLEYYFGKDFKIGTKILSEEEYTASELDNIKKYLLLRYNRSFDIKEGYKLTLDIMVENDLLKNVITSKMSIIKVNNNWFLLYY